MRTALRVLRRHRVYTALNVGGLAAGFLCVLLLMALVRHEMSFDRFHVDGERIHRLLRVDRRGDDVSFSPRTSGALGPALESAAPEIEASTRIETWGVHLWVGTDPGQGAYLRVAIVDADALEFFDFPTTGGGAPALDRPFHAVLTRQSAERLFGEATAAGRAISLEERHLAGDYDIVGVVDMPATSSHDFDVLVTHDMPRWDAWLGVDDFRPVETWVRLAEGVNVTQIAASAAALHPDADAEFELQPLHRMHLHGRADYGLPAQGDAATLYRLILLATFLLALAIVNFINLATARSVLRVREVGVRKAIGGTTTQLRALFLVEAVVLALSAMGLASLASCLAIGPFSALVARDLVAPVDPASLASAALIALVTGLLAGVYPAWSLASPRPAQALAVRGQPSGGIWLRRGLVVFQFVISVSLIAATLVVHEQTNYLRDESLEVIGDRVVTMPLFWKDFETVPDPANRLSARFEQVKATFSSIPYVESVTAYRRTPGTQGGESRHRVTTTAGVTASTRLHVIDGSFLSTFGLRLVAGEPLHDGDHERILINEALARKLNWSSHEAPLRPLRLNGRRDLVVAGVVQDYHDRSLRDAIEPLVFVCDEADYLRLAVRLGPGVPDDALRFLEDAWRQVQPERPFLYSFADADVAALYRDERMLAEITTAFAGLAVFVAGLGLVGLASFLTQRRTGEVAVRKVFGATGACIMIALSREYALLLLIASSIAALPAWWWIQSWLDGFAYRADPGVWPVVIAGSVCALIVGASVGGQAWRAAAASPVDALRNS